ncbi:MAG: hypothetical protein M3Y64_04065 [Gemmatimonadota bacterium]|nr:hypothetical protein [Gemmatimonadota bacterium]
MAYGRGFGVPPPAPGKPSGSPPAGLPGAPGVVGAGVPGAVGWVVGRGAELAGVTVVFGFAAW